MKSRMKRRARQLLCSFLCISMLLPNATPIISFAAEGLGNMPRRVSFNRPEALTLQDLRLATGSDAADGEMPDISIPDKGGGWILSEDEIDGIIHIATDSEAELRDPEFFYEDIPEEPDGVWLISQKRAGRT